MPSLPGSKASFNPFLYYAAVLLPWLTVPVGLYLFKNAWIATLAYLFGIVAFLLVFRPSIFSQDAPPRPVSKWLSLALLCSCLLTGVLIYFLWPWLGRIPSTGLASFLAGWGLSPRLWPYFVLLICLTTPWLEEMYWRIWLGASGHTTLETSAWFAGYHLLVLLPLVRVGWLLFAFASLSLAGLWWNRHTPSRRGFLWTTLTHLLADLSILLAITFLMA
jgi:hypothetical protein